MATLTLAATGGRKDVHRLGKLTTMARARRNVK